MHRVPLKLLSIILAVLLVNTTATAQLNSLEDIESIGKKGFFKNFFDFGDPFQLGGGIGLNLRSYSAKGGPLRQDPFFYTAYANVNIRVYQLDIPFSMILTAKNTTYSYPSFSDLKQTLKDKINDKKNGFSRFGFSPHYKWAKVHLGHRSMNFSKYTMSNINFFGGGVELTPQKFRFAAMYGRLAKAEPIDLSLTTPNLPVYKRIGWGTKIGYGDDKASADVILFTAKDDTSSVRIPSNYPRQVTPEANLALGIQLQKLFFNHVRIKLEYTNSAVSPNAQDANATKKSLTNFILPTKNTTYYSNALEGSLAYEGKKMNAGVSINRVDADFKTLGTYFFNRDIMDIQAFTSFGLIDGKLNTSLKGGIQTNNLDKSKPTTTKRVIYDLSTAWSSGDINVQVHYGNNTSDIGYVLNPALDSLNAVVVTQDAGLNITYNIPSKNENKQSISLTGNAQDVSDDIEKPSRQSTSKLYLINLGYTLTTQAKWSFFARGNYSQNKVQGLQLNRTGFGAGVKKSLFENKLSLGLNANYFLNKNALNQKSNNLIGQFLLGYQIFKGMNLQFNWGLLNTKAENTPSFTENTANLGLQYNFSYVPKKKNKK
ncbi:MAG: outer membrane beta-barrel family protein [Saprospiraceae bacterium]|jgi:hypothetical protein|nr:outer membrane beta-barrel protein [Saprospiraceae bacterium]MCO5278800.1 outer membrane beta-barrel family protein [Saprospiraceae bacterium]